jgi:hypothetical protein
MAIPPLNFIEPRAAVQLVCDRFECTEQEGADFLREKLIEKAIIPHWVEATPPPDDIDFSKIDWVSGAMVIRGAPRLAVNLGSSYYALHPERPHDRPEWGPSSRYPLKIDRRQLAAIIDKPAPGDGDDQTKEHKPKSVGRPSERDKIEIAVKFSLTLGRLKDEIPKEWTAIHNAICADAQIKDAQGWGYETVVGVAREPVERARRERAQKSQNR